MHKRDNPYTPGAGRKPPMLAGRDRDLEEFQALIERLALGSYERSLIYLGLRGVDKTVLLMEQSSTCRRPPASRTRATPSRT